MSEPLKKPGKQPESYTPKELPEILKLAEERKPTERLVETFIAGKALFELHDRPDVLWVGTLAWADNNQDEPDIDALLKKYQALCEVPKLERMNPDWSAGISINYCLGGKAPKGMLFAQETWSAQQDSRYDLFTQPAGLHLRVRLDKHAEKLMGKKKYSDADMYGLLEKTAAQHGYRRTQGNPIEIFYHDHEHHTVKYAIIPVEKAPEGCQPKDAPEIMKIAQDAQKSSRKKERFADRLGAVTLVELPKCMVASYERISSNPEQESDEFIVAWLLEKHGIRTASAAGPGDDGVVRYGFDCHKGRDICGENTACVKEQTGCQHCRIYHQYVTLPAGATIAGDGDIAVKEFPGGRFARVAVRDPFSCDFPSAWYVLLEWSFKRKIQNRLGCKSKKDCYSLFSNEESPCLEEIYWENGVQYMAMYLPVA